MRTHYGPWQPCWISNQHQKHKSGRGPSSEHFWQVWLISVQWFQRRRFKCEKLTDGQTTDAYPWQKLTWPMARWANNGKTPNLFTQKFWIKPPWFWCLRATFFFYLLSSRLFMLYCICFVPWQDIYFIFAHDLAWISISKKNFQITLRIKWSSPKRYIGGYRGGDRPPFFCARIIDWQKCILAEYFQFRPCHFSFYHVL